MDLAEAQDLLWRRLYDLDATGSGGFEGFLAAVLEDLTSQPFHVVKSGGQGGRDVRSNPCNLARVDLEAKRYGANTHLPLDALLFKLTEASTADPPADAWILASTRSIDSTYRDRLQALGETRGLGVVVWDSPRGNGAPADLAVVCAAATTACSAHLGTSKDTVEALECVRSAPDFAARAAYWRERLARPDVGYAGARRWCHRWLEDAQGSLANAKSRLKGHHNLRSSEFGVVRRAGVHEELDVWLAGGMVGLAALIGNEGTGKSWAALDWCSAICESHGQSAPLILFLPARFVEGGEARLDIAKAIAEQAGRGTAEFWRRRLELWEASGRDEIRILVVLDGLNQNFMLRDWANWAQPLFEERLQGMYAVLATCWPMWWEGELVRLGDLQPPPIEIRVGGFDDSELDELLEAMGVGREELAESVLHLMRVPRLSAVAFTHRKALAESGDITAERVVYEDWKDRIRRHGVTTGLDDRRMKEFIEALGRQLRSDVDQAIKRCDIMEILSHESGRSGEELAAAVAQLTSGGWFKAGDRADVFTLEHDKVHYALGAALMSDLKGGSAPDEVDTRIAEFLDPLQAHSLGPRILRAATTIALVEQDTPHHLRRALTSRWLAEQNFGQDDFEALWRLAGVDAKLFLGVAETEWLAGRATGFQDEVLVKALANAADFDTFEVALNAKLVEWLGTAWGDSLPDDNGVEGAECGDPAISPAKDAGSRCARWLAFEGVTQLAPVRAANDGEWSWLSRGAVAVMSYLARAPRAEALEAWALSRAIMGLRHQFDELAWILRVNSEDADEATEAMSVVLGRLKGVRHPVAVEAASILEAAISHVRRMSGAAVVPSPDEPGSRRRVPAIAIDRDDVQAAVSEYLGPDGWKRLDGDSAAALIDALIERGLPVGDKQVHLLSDRLREFVAIIKPRSRALLALAFEREVEASGGADLASSALLLRLFDATAREQSELLLASSCAPLDGVWWPIYRRPKSGDLQGLDIRGASPAGIVLWLDGVGRRLPKEQVGSLDSLPWLVTHEHQEIRSRALQMAAYGRHSDALRAFAHSPHRAGPVSGSNRSDVIEEYARNDALLELESMSEGSFSPTDLAAESAALRVHKGDVSDAALERFGAYLRDELKEVSTTTSWGMDRYWFAYADCMGPIVDRDGDSLVEWLRDWTNDGAPRAHLALMTDFPVLDLTRALKDKAPGVVLAAADALKKAGKRIGFFTDRIGSLPFEVPRSEISDAACNGQLEAAHTDDELLDIAYQCHKTERVGWLLERVAELEASRLPGDVARAFTLLGCCDMSGAADALWEEIKSRPPRDAWLRRVFRAGIKDYRRNKGARAEFERFWQADTEAAALNALKRVIEDCDRRVWIWYDDFDGLRQGATRARRLMASLGVRDMKETVRKDRTSRKRLLYHTQITSGPMAPWR